MLGYYLKCLFQYGLWPVSNIQRYSISWISCVVGESELQTPASVAHVKVAGLLREAVHDVGNRVTGLCLSCVRHGRYTEEDGNCHADLECMPFLGRDRARTG